jgi:pSer/pThr/pTyr-binding forkhead associated (FHA) protein
MKIQVKAPDGRLIEKMIPKDRATIGRSIRCDVAIPEESISREHCLIERQDGHYFITDLESANGVFINGKRIEVGVRTLLVTGTDFHLGILKCQVRDDLTSGHKLSLATLPHRTISRIIKPHSMVFKFSKKTPVRLPREKASKEKPTGLIVSSLFFLSIVGYMLKEVFQARFKSSPVSTILTEAPVVHYRTDVSKYNLNAPDKFLKEETYRELVARINCANHATICEEMKLSEEHGEGIRETHDEMVVFLKPIRRFTAQELPKLFEQPDRDQILGLFLFFRSSLFLELANSNVGQVHLVILDDQGTPRSVLRLHEHQFSETQRFELLADVKNAILNGNVAFFWNQHKAKIPKLSL